jgi:hypothetical protein
LAGDLSGNDDDNVIRKLRRQMVEEVLAIRGCKSARIVDAVDDDNEFLAALTL